jgi:hypothetical protein
MYVLALSALLPLGLAAKSPPELPTPTHRTEVFKCDERVCAMPGGGSYPHLILGRFQAAASAAQSGTLFTGMRLRGYWKALPDDPGLFFRNLQPVSVRLPDRAIMAVLMTQEEFSVMAPRPGDLIRYSPHRGSYEIPPADPVERAYWSIDGCIAVVCRAEDKACFDRYRQGVFRTSDGVQLSPYTFKPLKHAAAIDPDSLLPAETSKPGAPG